jgi:hypothetical protein
MPRLPTLAVLVALYSSVLPGAAMAQDEKPDKKNKKGKKADGTPPPEWELEIGGRLFVRDTLTRIEVPGDDAVTHTRGLDLARVYLTYDRKRLRVAFEVDFADGDADLKDTYVRVEPIDTVRIEVGRFKVPMSFLGLTSRWKLPSTERGILSELEVQDRDLPFAGERADGISVELRPALPLEPRVTLGTFQSPYASSSTPLDPREELTQDIYGRFTLEPVSKILKVATSVALIGYPEAPGEVSTRAEFPMASLEVELDARHVRLWAEGFAGESFFPQADVSVGGRFTAGRVLASFPFEVPALDLWRVEPFAGASLLDPSSQVEDDGVSELVGGLTVAFTKHLRLQLDASQRVTSGAAAPITDGTVVRLQLGANFAEVFTPPAPAPPPPPPPAPPPQP